MDRRGVCVGGTLLGRGGNTMTARLLIVELKEIWGGEGWVKGARV